MALSLPLDVSVEITPSPPPFRPTHDAPVRLGVCLSGGGSRALTGALGALSGLHSLPDPDHPSDATRSLMDRVAYLSSVSGGSWASVAYTYLPDTVDGEPLDDDTFLITPVPPDELNKAGRDASPRNVEHIDPRCLGSAPQQFAPVPIVRVLYKYFRWGMFSHPDRLSWFWTAAIGELILRRFGLYDAAYPKKSAHPQPDKTFGSSADQVRATITANNPELTPDQFHLVRKGRPSLIVNFNVLEDEHLPDPIQVPMQATPTDVGALGRWPGESASTSETSGEGSVQSFGFATHLDETTETRDTVTLTRRYCLADIAGCSSAFYAEDILALLTNETDKFEDAIESELARFHVPGFIRTWIRKWSMSKLEPILEADPVDLIPRYPFWRVSSALDAQNDGPRPGQPAATEQRGFSDGGSFENTGILGMLARSDANRIISFVNGAAPLSKQGDEIIVDGQIATLFGLTFDDIAGRYVPYAADNPRRFAKVFDEANFDELRAGLWNASTGNGSDADVGTYTTAHKLQLTTVDNDVAHVAGGRQVTVLWMVNNRVDAWQQQIIDPRIRADLDRGQAATTGTHDGNGHRRQHDRGPLAHFPLFHTGSQIYLHPEAVNLMAQLTAWNVLQYADDIVEMLDA